MTAARPDRLRLDETASGIGAIVLGIGLGVLMADRLAGFCLAILATGIAMHGWGMFDRHRQERQADAPDAWWEPMAYWSCWGLLAVLAVGVMARLMDMI